MAQNKSTNVVSHMRNNLIPVGIRLRSFIAFFLFIFISLTSIFAGGCFFTDNLEDMGELGIPLAGVKVLRKPFSYNWSDAVPMESSNYYEDYAVDIFNYLFNIYGVINQNPIYFPNTLNPFSEIIRHDTNPDPDLKALADAYVAVSNGATENADEFIYFYDAIRHQLTDVQTVTEAVDGEMVTYKVLRADLNAAWNWGLPYNLPSGSADFVTNSLLYEYVTDGIYGEGGMVKPKSATVFNGVLTNKFDEEEWGYTVINSFYSNPNYAFEYTEQHAFNNSLYSTKYLNDWTNPAENSEYITALTYAIYSIVLGLKPSEISVSYNPSTGQPSLAVVGFEPKDGKTSVELALENRKQLFSELGSYVGLTPRNKDAIAAFLLENVIGDGAMRHKEQMLYDKVVDSVVNYCSTLTKIGTTEGADDDYRGDDLDKAFPASEIVDYPFSMFFTDSSADDLFWHIPFAEYQSLLFLPLEETKVTDLWLDFKYDAGMDGDLIYDQTKFLDIDVHFRYYAGSGSEPTVRTMTIRVFDGPPNWGEDNTTLEAELEEALFGEPLKIGPLELPDAINAMEKEDKTIVLTGMVDARRYYKLLESTTSGGYGVIDHTKFSAAYLEVAFDVHKTAGDNQTNHKFKVGLSMLHEEFTYPNDPVWH